MISQIVSVASIFVCWIVATRFGSLVAPTIPVEPPWDQVLAMAVVFIITWIAIQFASAALEKLIKDWHLEKLNKLFGGVLGFAKGLLLCLIITFFSVMVSETSRDVVFNSKTGFHLVRLITRIGVFVPKDSYEFVHTQLASFQNKVDEAVPGRAPEILQVQSSETVQQLLGQAQQVTGKTETSADSLLTALSQWWNGTKNDTEETSVEKIVNPLVQSVTAQQMVNREEPKNSAVTYIPPPMSILPQTDAYTDIPPLATPQPSVAAEEFFIRRPETNASATVQQLTPLASSVPAIPALQSASLPALSSLAPLVETLSIPPEPIEILPLLPAPNHVGSDLLLHNSLQPARTDVPARLFRP